MRNTISCIGILIGGALVVVMGLIAVAAIANGFGQWQAASASKVESQEMTKRVAIQESAETDRAGIEWGAKVEIARWGSKGQIDSSWPGLFAHVFNVVAVVAGIAAMMFVGFLCLLRMNE